MFMMNSHFYFFLPSLSSTNNQSTLGTNISKTVIGTSFNLTGTTVNNLFGSTNTQLVTTITVTGRDSGARLTIPLKINKTSI